jgi:hypothetical protein
VDVKTLSIHRRIGKLSNSHSCTESSEMQAHMKQGFSLAIDMGYVMKDARKWSVDTDRDASDFDMVYYEKILEKA